ncbi:hypothetical protein [Rufibacter roseus]|uniref:Uncharacterized protein n=1 Tax=Rufibacter roseus TaxID=1567108 RepID=A0ABW2DR05_9BACT|nr:hypothetical protein [Rufibacter roseus]
MKVVGNLRNIGTKRDSKNAGIEIHLDQVEYLTSKKDGRYFQEYEYIDELESSMVITGDCLALDSSKKLDEGEYEFKVYDKIGEEYVLNENKQLTLTMVYDFEENLHILSIASYHVTLAPDDFKELKKTKEREKQTQKGKSRK